MKQIYKASDFVRASETTERLIHKKSVEVNTSADVYTPPPGQTVFLDFEKTLFVDVDETLVFVSYPEKYDSHAIDFSSFGFQKRILPHWKHVETIKEFRARGIGVMCWSAGGGKWTKAVIEQLGLMGWVHIIQKPTWIMDDKDPRFWLSPTRFYKNIFTGADTPNLGERTVTLSEQEETKKD